MKCSKFEKQPSENVMKMLILWVLHMTQSTNAGVRKRNIQTRLQRLFHTECDCNMYTTVYKALFQFIYVTHFLIDQPLLEVL